MSDFEWQDGLTPTLRMLQIIVAALSLGLVFFLAIAVSVPFENAPNASTPLLTYVALGFAILALIVRVIVPGIATTAGRRAIARGEYPSSAERPGSTAGSAKDLGDVGRLAALMVTRTIVGAAILESSCFFLLIAFLLERSPLTLAVAVFFILGVAAHTPTQGRMAAWLESQLKLLDEDRQLGRMSH